MKAAVVHGIDDIRIEDIPTPEPSDGEVLVRVRGSGVCATDVKILGGNGLPKHLPTILGHEVAGAVEKIGPQVGGLAIGDRVAVYPIAACGRCFYCMREMHSLCVEPYGLAHGADGGFAEYLLVPRQIVALGGIINIGNMPYDLAAMIEPVSCCLSAAERCGTGTGQTVVIIGCGPLGQLHTIVSKTLGAKVIAVDKRNDRLARAEAVGADITLDPTAMDLEKEIRRLTDVGADVVIAAVGITSVVEQSMACVRNGGVFNIFGGTPSGEKMQIDPRLIHYGEVTVTGTFAASLSQFIRAFDFVSMNSSAVSDVITERCNLGGLLNAVRAIKQGSGQKTILTFSEEATS